MKKTKSQLLTRLVPKIPIRRD